MTDTTAIHLFESKQIRTIWNKETDEWKNKGVEEGVQFAILTDIIYKTWVGKITKGYFTI